MAVDPAVAVQTAIYDALTGDTPLMAAVTGVYDFVPEGTTFPYVAIGDLNYTEWSGHTFDGADCTVNIHTWARGAGRKGALDVMALVFDVLHKSELSVTGFTTVSFRRDFHDIDLDPDGQTYHGVQRFRLLIGGAA